jgi:hypothetical protein
MHVPMEMIIRIIAVIMFAGAFAFLDASLDGLARLDSLGPRDHAVRPGGRHDRPSVGSPLNAPVVLGDRGFPFRVADGVLPACRYVSHGER